MARISTAPTPSGAGRFTVFNPMLDLLGGSELEAGTEFTILFQLVTAVAPRRARPCNAAAMVPATQVAAAPRLHNSGGLQRDVI